ncbi:MAG TPA: YwiC-like family protein [Acidobacteriota bacterium]|nr:YwiC-like family protein [Acidobacteriota bacterium]
MKGTIPILLPREHGAWAILYGSFLTGLVAAGRFSLSLLLFLLAVSGVFLAHEPLVKLVRSLKHGGRRELMQRWAFWVAVELTTVSIAGAILVFHYRLFTLLPVGLFVALLLGLHLKLTAGRKERSVPGELIGVVGLTSAGPSVYYVGFGEIDTAFWLIWSLNVLYFASGIFYVKMRVSRFLKPALFKSRVRDCVTYHTLQTALLLAAAFNGWISWLMFLAFVPVICRAFWHTIHSEQQLNIKRIGYSEVAFTVAFIVLFATGWS